MSFVETFLFCMSQPQIRLQVSNVSDDILDNLLTDAAIEMQRKRFEVSADSQATYLTNMSSVETILERLRSIEV